MSTPENLLNLDVNKLFEQHGVAEIDIVHKKIQAVVEQKREELRTMVGERYRDLLQAADTITVMRDTAETLVGQVASINANCRHLNDQQLIGFKVDESMESALLSRNANKQLNNYFATMVQVKLLTSLPELIWSHIDREHFYAATELFIFSRHISTGLQLDVHNPLMQHLPMAKKQWEILKPFHVTIKQSVLAVLEREELSAEMAVDCLLSLMLLEKTSLNAVFRTLLQMRCHAFRTTLSSDVAYAADGHEEKRRVKDRILASLRVLNGTMAMVAQCFLPGGSIFARMAAASDVGAPPTVSLMDSNDAQFAYLLPEIIANFRPKHEAPSLEADQASATLEQWHQDITRIAGTQLKDLFGLVTAMSVVQDIKTEATGYRKDLHLAPLIEGFGLAHSLDFYEDLYIPVLNQRVRNIIQQNWSKAVQAVFEKLQTALQAETEVDAKDSRMWLDRLEDLPLSLAEALNEDTKSKALLMKTKGYNKEIIAMCTAFDVELASIVGELDVLLQEQAAKQDDKAALMAFMRETAEGQLRHFLDQIKGLHLEQQQRKELLTVVRTCAALVELCPHLRVSFCGQASWRELLGAAGSDDGSAHWIRLCSSIKDEVFGYWRSILDGILAEHNLRAHLPAAISPEVMLEDFASWETMTVEQGEDQESPVQTTFRIPSQPRISLQSFFFTLIELLNVHVPQTLPSEVQHVLSRKLLQQLFDYYERLLPQTPEAGSGHATAINKSNQRVALQLYFDLKFLQGSFGVARDERPLYEQLQRLLSCCKDTIDPFDFELFAEQIAASVQRSVTRLHCLLGVLVPQSVASTAAHATSFAQEKDPNVLGLSTCGSTTFWFPLLPIVKPNTAAATAEDASKSPSSPAREKTTPTRKSGGPRRSDGGKTKSFFGAMSQEWFR